MQVPWWLQFILRLELKLYLLFNFNRSGLLRGLSVCEVVADCMMNAGPYKLLCQDKQLPHYTDTLYLACYGCTTHIYGLYIALVHYE